MISNQEGQKLIKFARMAVQSVFQNSLTSNNTQIDLTELSQKYSEKRGVFVTIKKKNQLRGCIGYPQPVYPLLEAIRNAAKAAAFEDTRFPPLREDELTQISIELSVLTVPELISNNLEKPIEVVKKIKIGRDGIIVKMGHASGLLLPQVAEEWKWDVLEFLGQTCIKAGLPPHAWQTSTCEVYTFHAQIFTEKE